MTLTLEQASNMFDRAVSEREIMDGVYQDIYRYSMPYRNTMYGNPIDDFSKEIYDSTAVDSTESFANFLHHSMTPPEYRWFEYAAGSDVAPMMRERVQTLLDAVTERFFTLLWSTNFDTEINQSYRDVAAGMGAFAIRDYGKFGSDEAPATFVATPPFDIYVLDGREGDLSRVFRRFRVEPDRIKTIWPDAKMEEIDLEKLKNNKGNKGKQEKIEVVECCYYDYDTKKYHYKVFLKQGAKSFIVDDEMIYSSWIVFRWSVVTGEVSGRGPLHNALADIKTANKVVELILQNASISLSGIYTAVDDGVLNPNNIELVPGTIIPVAYNGGNFGKSLDLLERAGDFDVSQLVLKDLRQSIRRKLLDDDLAPLDDAVRSQHEVALRQQQAAKRAGPNVGRIRTEMIYKTVKELTVMWQNKGLLPPFQIDGKSITLRFTSPLAKQQNNEDLGELDSYIARMNALQPGFAPLTVKPEEYAHFVAEKTGVPMRLINSKDDLIKAQQIMGQKIAEGGPEGQEIVKGFTQ